MTSSGNDRKFEEFDQRLDRIITLDFGGRGVEHLYRAARERQKYPLTGAAADCLASIPSGSTVLITTGSVSRAWISPTIGENDGPAGAAAVVRALVIARKAVCVVLAEESLLQSIGAILTTAGLSVATYEQARAASIDGSLASVCLRSFPLTDEEAPAAAARLLDELEPKLLFSTERVGRNADGIYCSMRGLDYGMGRARIDYVFEEARRRSLPTVSVGDGGNEIGMGVIAQAVRDHVKFGDKRPGGGAGIGAVSCADVLVTAACSNWGCYGIVAALAARLADSRLIHTPEMENLLLRRGIDVGLINTVDGFVDANVDGISALTHTAIVQLLGAVIQPLIR